MCFAGTEKENPNAVKLSSASLQNKKKVVPGINKTLVKDKVDKNDHGTTDEKNCIFKRTALEEKLIAFSHTTDECFSDSDSEAETEQKKNTDVDTGVAVVTNSNVSKNNKGCEVKSSISNTSTSSLNSNSSAAIAGKSSGAAGSVTTDTSKTGDEDIKKEVVEKYETFKTKGNDVKLESKVQATVHEDGNEQHNGNKKESSRKQEEDSLEHTPNMFFEEKSTDIVMSVTDDEGFKKDVETLKGNVDCKLDNKKFCEPHKDIETKEDTNLNSMIEDLQKYGTGMDIEMKTTKEIDKSAKVKKEKLKVEQPKLTDVNFFSADISKKNKKKGSKREKEDANTVKKEETSRKDTNKLRKQLSGSKLATTKEKSKIQRYKELKKLVKDSEKKVSEPEKDSVSISEEKSSSRKTERTKEAKQLNKDSKTKICATTKSGKVSTFRKDESPTKHSRTSKEPVLSEGDNSVAGSLKISTSKSENKDAVIKTERNKELKVKDSLTKPNVVTEADEPTVIISSDSEGTGQQIKKSIVHESDMDNSMEDESEENELLRIFNEYDPDNDEQDVMDGMDNYMMSIDTEDQSTIPSLPKSKTGLKRSSTETPAVGFKKQRVAHQPNLVSKGVSVFNHSPKRKVSWCTM